MAKHFQIAALQDNFQDESGVLAMPEKWHNFGFSHEQLLHTHADMYSANYDPGTHHDLIAEYLKRSRANQLKTIIYMNCHILGPSLDGHRRDWGVVEADGSYTLLYNTYVSCCLNSPWREHFFAEIAAMAEFDIEGFFFDGPFYRVCHCPHCQAKFRQENPGRELENATPEEQKKFAFKNVIEFKDALRKQVKSVNPNWLMYFNEGLMSGRGNVDFLRAQLKSDDIIGTEGGFFFYSEPKTHNYWHTAWTAKLAAAVAAGRPTVIFFAADHKPWGWSMHTPAESQLCYQAALANGASVWYGFHSTPENLNSRAAQTISQLVKFDRDHQELYENSQSTARIALFYSFNTQCHYQHAGAVSDFYNDEATRRAQQHCNYTDSVQGAAALLEHLSLPYEVVTELNLDDLPKYQVVCAPVLAMLDAPTQQALETFVRNGGTVILDGEAGQFDQNGQLVGRDHWKDFLGVTPGEAVANNYFNYFGVKPELYTPDNAFNYLRKPQTSFVLTDLAPDTEVIGRANAVMAGCYQRKPGDLIDPAVTRHAFGQGQVYYFGMDFFGFYQRFQDVDYRNLLHRLFQQIGVKLPFVLENSRPGVMFNVRKCANGHFLASLNNYVGATRPLAESYPVRGLKIRTEQKFTAARELLSGVELQQDRAGLWVLPELDRIMTIEFQ